jgi:hypothetical protein
VPSVKAPGAETRPPLADRDLVDAFSRGHLLVRQPFRAGQYDAATLRQRLGAGRPARPTLEGRMFVAAEQKLYLGTSASSHGRLPSSQTRR